MIEDKWIGVVFDRLTIESIDPVATLKYNEKYYVCRCTCGGSITLPVKALKVYKQKCCKDCRTTLGKDLVGKIFGRWEVISLTNKRSYNGSKIYMCRCGCLLGTIKEVPGKGLLDGTSKNCGLVGCKGENITGKKFNRLTAVTPYIDRDGYTTTKWVCQCDCGNTTITSTRKLKEGTTKSCGCYHKERAKEWMGVLRPTQVGVKNPSYNPNLTDEDRILRRSFPENAEWASKVKKLANYTCDCCCQVGHELRSHHLNSYKDFPEQRVDVENGVCLCNSCHKLFHKLYGVKNVTKDQYYEFRSSFEMQEAA